MLTGWQQAYWGQLRGVVMMELELEAVEALEAAGAAEAAEVG